MLELAITLWAALTTPCASEHMTNCHHHAPTMSAGEGLSFISLAKSDGAELVIYPNQTWRTFP